MPDTSRAVDASTGARLTSTGALKTWAAFLLVFVLAQAVVLTWRWGGLRDRAPSTYYEFQIERWELQSVSRPDDPVVWATLGGLYSGAGEDEKASKAYSQALQLDPGNVAALLHAAEDDIEAGRESVARERLEAALEALPEGGRYLAYYRLGELEEEAGRLDAAIQAYQASVTDSDKYWNAYYRLALLYEARGRVPEALAAAEQAETFAAERVEVADLVRRLRDAVGTDPAKEAVDDR